MPDLFFSKDQTLNANAYSEKALTVKKKTTDDLVLDVRVAVAEPERPKPTKKDAPLPVIAYPTSINVVVLGQVGAREFDYTQQDQYVTNQHIPLTEGRGHAQITAHTKLSTFCLFYIAHALGEPVMVTASTRSTQEAPTEPTPTPKRTSKTRKDTAPAKVKVQHPSVHDTE